MVYTGGHVSKIHFMNLNLTYNLYHNLYKSSKPILKVANFVPFLFSGFKINWSLKNLSLFGRLQNISECLKQDRQDHQVSTPLNGYVQVQSYYH